MINIRVAVRIRPFSQRELIQNDVSILMKEDKCILVTNPKLNGKQDGDTRKRTRRFMVDFCYDPRSPETSSQEAVYREIGMEVLDSMFKGFNACVLAYGHSASGKTYTMMGIPNDPGLTPRICQGLFDSIDSKSSIQYQVAASFLEIYNEKVRDLLAKDEEGYTPNNFSLRIREHPKLGPYVQDLTQHLVTEKSRLLELLNFGNRRRSTATTENNIHSSRSHAVFTLRFKQTFEESYEIEKFSKVHFVDLAGSERASGAQNKTRLKEGANINKSLVALGNVISALAENCEAAIIKKEHSTLKTWQPFVPYRDSVLTWLLKDTLGGNSNTIMIATVSPASSCLNETVNTLRYAKRTKKIVNQPMINEDPKSRTIRELKEEIIRLKFLLKSYCTHFNSTSEISTVNKINLAEGKNSEDAVRKWQTPIEGMQCSKQEKGHNEMENFKRFPLEKNIENSNKLSSTSAGDGIDDSFLNVLKNRHSQRENCKKLTDHKLGFSHVPLETQKVIPLENNSCEINDEKLPGVNGLDADSCHETNIFSGGLESFSSSALKSKLSKNEKSSEMETTDRIDFEKRKSSQLADPDIPKDSIAPARRYKFCLKKESGSHANATKLNSHEILHKSRPNLMKSVATHSEEGLLPSVSSQSYTDVSNLSRSKSEHSFNSLGRLERPVSDNTKMVSDYTAQNRHEKKEYQTVSHRKGKRSEIVEAVTTRLYMSKNKSENEMEALQVKKTGRDIADFELEEIKMCKRARSQMNRKGTERKMKKTVDGDTQTDFNCRSLRVKDKSVMTDQKGTPKVENWGTNTPADENFKTKYESSKIVNRIFMPRSTVFSVDFKNDILTKAPALTWDGDSSIPSPTEFFAKDEECFSEDSLDKDEMSNESDYIVVDRDTIICREEKISADYLSISEDCDSESYRKEIQSPIFNGFDGTDLNDLKNEISRPVQLLSELKVNENFSTETPFTSLESADAMRSLSETSSEDFIIYENATEEDETDRTKENGGRELYTITENSDQSDSGDIFSPVRNKKSSDNGPRASHELRESPSTLLNLNNGSRDVSEKDEQDELNCNETVSKIKCIHANKTPYNQNQRTPILEDNLKVNNYFINCTDSCTGDTKEITKGAEEYETLKHKKDDGKLYLEKGSHFLRSSAHDGVVNNLEMVKESNEGNGFKANDPKGTHQKSNSTNKDNVKKIQKAEIGGFYLPKARKLVNCMNLKTYGQTQFLNFNILNSPKRSQFSVVTDLFEGVFKKDQSTETMFGSDDSITFVFMGPAKPKTSVLMEVIARSLNKGATNEIDSIRRKSRRRGVQCESKLVRSMSVDTALIALSRIARQPSQDISRTVSLENFAGKEETLFILERGKSLGSIKESSCQCDLDKNYGETRTRKKPLQYSVSTSTSRDQQTETVNLMYKEPENLDNSKLSVGWRLKKWKSDTDGVAESNEEVHSSVKDDYDSNTQTRRVRFSNPQTERAPHEFSQKESINKSADSISSLLKEATTLLKTLYDFKLPTNEVAGERERKRDQSKSGSTISSDRCPEGIHTAEECPPNSTFPPRRQSNSGKPSKGTKSLRSLLSQPGNASTFNHLYSNGFSDPIKHKSNRMESSIWSTPNGNSYTGERQREGFPGSNKFTPSKFNRFNFARIDHESIYDLEAELEESCHRLKLATEQDKIRQEISERKTITTTLKHRERERTSSVSNFLSIDDDDGDNGWEIVESVRECEKPKNQKEPVKRRKMTECVHECVCKNQGKHETRACTGSKAFRSTLELNTFGLGSNHCLQFCLFCRQKDAELYCSNPILNSDCSPERCRLDYYGHCPCTPVKLPHVSPSPRAYMQHLLTLRRRIVQKTKINAITQSLLPTSNKSID